MNTKIFTAKSFKEKFQTMLPYLIVVLICDLIAVLAWTGPYPNHKFLVPTALLASFLLIIGLEQFYCFDRLFVAISGWFRKEWTKVKAIRWKRLLILVGASLVLSLIGGIIWSKGFPILFLRWLFLFAIIFLIGFVVLFRDLFLSRVEIVVSVVILTVGGVFAVGLPASCGISWDDEEHFRTACYMSHMLEGRLTYGEYYILNGFAETALEHDVYTQEEYSAYLENIDTLDDEESWVGSTRAYPAITNWCYLPSMLGLLVGRTLHLPYHLVFILGRIFNLITYALLVYLAIKQLKSGKMIFAAVALLPPMLLMAGTYSRDPWMVGFLMLGLGILFGELQQPEKKMTIGQLIGIPLILLIGAMPKAVYFPLVCAALFIPQSKYPELNIRGKKISAKTIQIIYIIFAIVLALAALSSFALPFLQSSGGAVQDNRGGDVNAAGQVAYILAEPLTFAKTMGKFLLSYISFENAASNFCHLHYFGEGDFSVLVIIVLAVVTLTDRSKEDAYVNGWTKAAVLVTSFGAMLLCAVAMYVAFTPYQYDTVLGCQYRYIFQFLAPVLFVLGGFRFENKIYKAYSLEKIAKTYWYRLAVLALMVFVTLSAFYKLCLADFY